MIITIDGAVGTGKSTIAKRLAERLGFIYFDTGAMYRCVTFGVLKHNINPDDTRAMKRFLESFSFDFKMEHGEKHYYYEGEDITRAIREHAVTSLVSKVSALGMVREKLVPIQRRLGESADAVFEGRDIGTVVFPHARFKFFLIASPDVRAERRFAEMKEKYPEASAHLTLQEVRKSLDKRDAFDSSRELSPLKQAPDARVIDTSNLSIEEVLDAMMRVMNLKR